MLNLVEEPGKSVLCVGHIGRDRYEDAAWLASYRIRLYAHYRRLSSEGFHTYLFLNRDLFDLVSSGALHRIKAELVCDYRLPFVFLMGVFGRDSIICEAPPRDWHFDESLYPQEDDAHLAASALLDDVLENVSAILFDDTDGDPHVRRIVARARRCGKRLLEV